MFFAPLTFTDILKMLWWSLRNPAPPAPVLAVAPTAPVSRNVCPTCGQERRPIP